MRLQERAARQAANKNASCLPLSGACPTNFRRPPIPTKSLSLELVNFQDPEV